MLIIVSDITWKHSLSCVGMAISNSCETEQNIFWTNYNKQLDTDQSKVMYLEFFKTIIAAIKEKRDSSV